MYTQGTLPVIKQNYILYCCSTGAVVFIYLQKSWPRVEPSIDIGHYLRREAFGRPVTQGKSTSAINHAMTPMNRVNSQARRNIESTRLILSY